MIEIDTTKRKGKFFSVLFMFMLLLCTPFYIAYEKISNLYGMYIKKENLLPTKRTEKSGKK